MITVLAATYAYRPMRQNWCTGQNAPTVTWSSTVTCPASVAPFTNSVCEPIMQSWAMCA